MTVAVTGASGFVGRHVVAQLHRRGISPTLVRRTDADIAWAGPGDRLVTLDLAAATASPYDLLGRPEVLIHLAWGGLPKYGSAHHLDQELPAQVAFLDGLLAAGLGALAVTGTCLEYGLQAGALREDAPTAPVTAYGSAKDQLRRHLEARRAARPFDLTWARLFYVHGPGQAPSSLLPQLERAIDRGDEAFDMSGGQQIRDFMPIEEAADAIVTLALNGRDNGVVNVCSGRPVSVRDFVAGVVAGRGASIRLNLGAYPYPAYEPIVFWGDRSKLDRCLGVAA